MAKVSGILGDGINTSFVIALGFDTEDVAARLFDLGRDGNEVFAFQLARQTPVPTSVTITLTPAPVLGSIYYSISDETEKPDSSPP